MHLEGRTFLIVTVSYRERSMPVYGSLLTFEGLADRIEQDQFTLNFVPRINLLVIDVGHSYIRFDHVVANVFDRQSHDEGSVNPWIVASITSSTFGNNLQL